MSRRLIVATGLGLLALGTVVSPPATAAPPVAGYVGEASSSVAGCPFILWRLARHDNGEITGIVYYSDLSGTSMAKGTMDKAGMFHLDLSSAMGSGPVGTVDGTRSSNGRVVAVMKGEGCANMHLSIKPSVNLNAPSSSKGEG